MRHVALKSNSTASETAKQAEAVGFAALQSSLVQYPTQF